MPLPFKLLLEFRNMEVQRPFQLIELAKLERIGVVGLTVVRLDAVSEHLRH
jgi:hypothetical protein